MIFVTHADVLIDPQVDVPDWPLAPRGRARHVAFNEAEIVRKVGVVYSSAERKAAQAGEILARARDVPHKVIEALHENDRSATGYLPSDEFEKVADAFFASPTQSVRGWERACDAQDRVVKACQDIARNEAETDGDIAVVAHGGVGALFLAHLKGADISRSFDQPPGKGGHYISVSLPDWHVTDGWRDIAPGFAA
ncbi:histidine phosphatase family protein [Thalassococcus sp. S3]|nr:histidine phosphatase family protein [Thalassococcus sp. S3]